MPYHENANPSIMERKAALLLSEGDMIFVTEFSFPDLKSSRGRPLRFDFAVFETLEDLEKETPKFLLELNGEQHYAQKFQTKEEFIRQQSNDKKKKMYCAAKGIPLVIVPYTEYHSMTLDGILEEGRYFD